MDGANARQRMFSITLPALKGLFILLLILRLGSSLSVGFEQIVLQQGPVGLQASEVLDTWVYNYGILGGKASPPTPIKPQNPLDFGRADAAQADNRASRSGRPTRTLIASCTCTAAGRSSCPTLRRRGSWSRSRRTKVVPRRC